MTPHTHYNHATGQSTPAPECRIVGAEGLLDGATDAPHGCLCATHAETAPYADGARLEARWTCDVSDEQCDRCGVYLAGSWQDAILLSLEMTRLEDRLTAVSGILARLATEAPPVPVTPPLDPRDPDSLFDYIAGLTRAQAAAYREAGR